MPFAWGYGLKVEGLGAGFRIKGWLELGVKEESSRAEDVGLRDGLRLRVMA